MDTDGLVDPRDLGLPAHVDPEQLAELRRVAAEAEKARRWREANLPSGPPATGRTIERARAAVGMSRSSRSRRLLSRCERHRAAPGAWCGGRFGHLCAERPEADG
jgi:hypothetical protein